MKNLLLQHRNKTAFIFSFCIHAVLFVCFLDFSIKFSEVKSPEPLSILVYSPPQPIVEEVVEEKVEEVAEVEPEITQVAPKVVKKPKKIKKERKKEIKEVAKEPLPAEQNLAKSEVKSTPAPVNEARGGGEVDELIAHIQATLNKEAQKNYPMSARKRRQQGIVKVGFIYDKGTVKHIKIISPSKHDALNEAAVKSVREAKFRRIDRTLTISSVSLKFNLH